MARLLIGAGALLLAMTLFPRRCGDPAADRAARGNASAAPRVLS
jgi:hypothetical protein